MKKVNEPYHSESEDETEQVSVLDYYKNKIQEENEGQRTSYAEIEIINRYGATDERVNLNMNFLGLDLSKVPGNHMGDWTVYIIPALYVISSIVSIRLTTSMTSQKKKKDVVVNTEGVEEEASELEAMEAMNKNMSYMMPIMSVFIAFIAPLGLALYWFVSNVLMVIERLIINLIMKHKGEEENA